MNAYRLITSLQLATGIPTAGIVLSFLVAPHWTRSVFGPEFLLLLVLTFAVLTFVAMGIAFSSESDVAPASVSRERLRTVFLTNGGFVIAAGLNGWVLRDWPIALSFIVLGLGVVLLGLSRRYR